MASATKFFSDNLLVLPNTEPTLKVNNAKTCGEVNISLEF
jgi:hypothetical protein